MTAGSSALCNRGAAERCAQPGGAALTPGGARLSNCGRGEPAPRGFVRRDRSELWRCPRELLPPDRNPVGFRAAATAPSDGPGWSAICPRGAAPPRPARPRSLPSGGNRTARPDGDARPRAQHGGGGPAERR